MPRMPAQPYGPSMLHSRKARMRAACRVNPTSMLRAAEQPDKKTEGAFINLESVPRGPARTLNPRMKNLLYVYNTFEFRNLSLSPGLKVFSSSTGVSFCVFVYLCASGNQTQDRVRVWQTLHHCGSLAIFENFRYLMVFYKTSSTHVPHQHVFHTMLTSNLVRKNKYK